MPSVEIAEVQKNWSERGFSCGLWVDVPGQVWRDYTHPVDELLMVVEGALELEIDGTTLKPVIGEEVFIPAHATHTVRNVGATTSRWLYGYRRRSEP